VNLANKLYKITFSVFSVKSFLVKPLSVHLSNLTTHSQHNTKDAPKDNLLRGSQGKQNATCFSLQDIYQTTTKYWINKNFTPTKLQVPLWWHKSFILGLGRNLTSAVSHNMSNFSSKRNKHQIPSTCSKFLWSFN